MIDIDKLSNTELNCVQALQMRMQKEYSTEICEDIVLLYRFLKARNFNVDKAENMLRTHLTWRKSFQVGKIMEDFKPAEIFCKYIEPSHLGLDKEGNVIKYLPLGRIYGADVQECIKLNEYVMHYSWFVEKELLSKNYLKEKTNRKFRQILMILNLDELTVENVTNKHSVNQCIRIFRLLTDNYPEILKSLYVINAPKHYILMYSIVKEIMSKELKQKFQIFGRNGWKEKLLEVIDADILPAFLGGNRTDPDGNPLCKTFVHHGGRIPHTFHLQSERRWFKYEDQVKRILISARKKENICVDVSKRECKIQWKFLINDKDIGFGLLFKGAKSRLTEEVLPVQRYDTSDGIEVGSYKAQHVGKYIIVFDNSHSWMTSKEVQYCITIT